MYCVHLTRRPGSLTLIGLGIQQDNVEDWAQTAASMADIYAGAEITIAASWSKDSTGGLFRPGRRKVVVNRILGQRLVVQMWPNCPDNFLVSPTSCQ